MAGIKDIAQITGLSLATVSRVFNNSSLVSTKTKTKVLQAAKELDYQPNAMAAALRSGKTKTLGVIVPEINNYFFSSIINGIEQKAQELGYNIIIAQSHESAENENKALISFLRLKVDGILLSISKETNDFSMFRKLEKNKIPVVFFDRAPYLNQTNMVVLDDEVGAFMATQHLIKQGCKNIVHIAGNSNVSIFEQRKKGFIKALRDNEIALQKNNVLELIYNKDEDLSALKLLFLKNPSIDGMFVYGDESCLYVMNMLKILNVNIPEELRIIGFGNSEYSALTDPPMSTIDQKSGEMGRRAATILLKELHQEPIKNSKYVLVPKLIPRNSTGKK